MVIKMAGGRPKKEIDFETLDKLMRIQCTEEECASFFDIDVKTLKARIKEEYGVSFSQYFEQKSKKGKVSLRRKQWEVALSGNVTMLIWLGKQYLGQTDKNELSGGTEPIKIIIEDADKESKKN